MNPLPLLLFALVFMATGFAAEPPGILNYQGRINVDGSAFNGAGSFKFALVDAAGTTTFWSNDGTSATGDEPSAAVALTVTSGRYSVGLGDTALTNMSAAVPAAVFADNADVRLRIWFDDGVNGSQLLAPDQRLGAVGYALTAGSIDAAHVTGTLEAGQLPAGVLLDGTSGVSLSGSFTGDGSGLTGIDLGAQTITETLDLSGNDLAAAGTVTATAFAGDGSGLTSLDSTRLTGPLTINLLRIVGEIDNGGSANDVAVSGGYAYLADLFDGLRIYDVTDPANPINLGLVDDGGSARGVALSGNHAYLANGSDGLRVYDVTAPATPVGVGHIDDGGSAFDIALSGDYAYVANFADGLRVYDITTPTSPNNVGHVPNVGETVGITVSGTNAFLVSQFTGLRIFDITDPTNPVLLSHVNVGAGRDVAVSGPYAYLADSSSGVRIYNITDPANPTDVGRFGAGETAQGVTLAGDHLYVANYLDGLRVYDITEPTSPVSVGYIDNGASFLGPTAKAVAVSGDFAFLANGNGGLRIFDVSGSVSAPNFQGNFFGDGSGLTGIDLGAHTATQALDLSGNDISSAGTVTATAFVGDGSGLTNVPGDDLGSHIATTDLNLDGNWLTNGTSNRGLNINAGGSCFVQTDPDVLGIQLRSGNGPGLRFFQDNTQGWGEYLWDVAANESNFFIRDTSNASNLPFRIKSGSSDNRIVIEGNNVGIGIDAPATPLEVGGDIRLNGENPNFIFYDATGGGGARRSSIETVFHGDVQDPPYTAADQEMRFNVSNNNGTNVRRVMTLFGDGKVGIGTTAPGGQLDVAASGDGTSVLKLSIERAWEFQQENSGSSTNLRLRNVSGLNKQFSIDTNGRTNFRTQNGSATVMTVDHANARVGIGTTNPTRAKLDIQGQSGSTTLPYGYLNSSGNTGTSSATSAYSVYATNRIAAQEFRAHSDQRIKNIQGTSDADKDLQTLMGIEVADYTLRDTVAHGDTPQKKVIAQQVADVYPQAVSSNLTEVVPDIYLRAGIEGGWVSLTTDLKPGEKVKLIREGHSGVYEVLAIREGAFQVDWNHQGDVFVYGREVDDFHTVDYEAIAMLNVSATQEQQRLIEKQQAEIASLKGELETLKELVSALVESKKAGTNPVASR